MIGTATLKIDPEFKALIPPLTPEELAQLESNIRAEGCRDPLVAWRGLILDGHNRQAICARLGAFFETVDVDLPSRDEAKAWIVRNQLGRRNLTPDQASYLRGSRYNTEKKQGARSDLTSAHNEQKLETRDRLAEEYKVSPVTIRRDGQFAKAVDSLARLAGEQARETILKRDAPITKKDVVKLAEEAKKEPEKAKAVVQAVVSGEARSVRQAKT